MLTLAHLAAKGDWYSRAKTAGAPDTFTPPGKAMMRLIVEAIRSGTVPEKAREYVADLLLFLAGSTETRFKRPTPPAPRRGRRHKSIPEKWREYQKILEAVHSTPKQRRAEGGYGLRLDRIAEISGHSVSNVRRALSESNYDSPNARLRPVFDGNGKLIRMTISKRRQ